MVSALYSSTVDLVKPKTINLVFVASLHTALSRKSKDWLGWNHSNMHKNVLIVHPVKIPVKFGFIQQSGFREED
jgi:hypothetical protein